VPYPGDADLRARYNSVIDLEGVEYRQITELVHAAVAAIQIGSNIDIQVAGYWTRESGSYQANIISDVGQWGHHGSELTDNAVLFARAYTPVLLPLIFPETYSRMANATRLYLTALDVNVSDLALLGFVGAIESLFSIEPQELTFRLALQMAKIASDSPDEQRHLFNRTKALYAVRSKVAHGARIAPSEEQAAIQLADRWVPEAEELARLGLKRILERDLVGIFNSADKHTTLLKEVLFVASLDDALRRLS
jgi:hypothetical protein